MVRLEILDKPTLKKVKMNCDEAIDKKLCEYPMIEDCWSHTSFNVIVGKMGQGKTSLITNLVKNVFKRCFNKIYVFIPHNSRVSIDNDIYGNHLPDDQLFDTLTEENLNDVYERLKQTSSDGDHSLLIIDDFQTQLKDPNIIRILAKIITKMRHLRTTIFLLQQNFQSLDKSLRELVSNLIMFNIGKSQLTKVFDEVIQIDKSKYNDIIDLAFVDRNDWICYNNNSKNMYRMFDKIIIDEE